MYVHALMAKVRLEGEGIGVVLENENTVLANPLYSYALGGVVVKVKEEDRERALSILDQKDSEERTGCVSFCPRCDSESIGTVEKSVWGIRTHPVNRCNDCGYRWSPIRF